MKEKLQRAIEDILVSKGIATPIVLVEYPGDMSHGDFAINAALRYAKELKMKPTELAAELAEELKTAAGLSHIEKIEVAGPGFINVTLVPAYFSEQLGKALEANFGTSEKLKGKKIMVEYTDANAFKPLHIGHLMSNAIGEAIATLHERAGAEVVRAHYSGDIGLHVAKAVWGMKVLGGQPKESATLAEKADYLGRAYVKGSDAEETDETAKNDIAAINKKLFEKSDAELNALYDIGRRWSYESLEDVYRTLGTIFRRWFYESELAEEGKRIVLEQLKAGVFKESEGAVVFPGEDYGLHTRVFLTSAGLPPYEAKELALNVKKFEVERGLDSSVIITANEQNGYFKVLKKALDIIFPEIGKKTIQFGHGMLRFASGKMSSRKGNVITALGMLDELKASVGEVLRAREWPQSEKDEVAEKVAIGAFKYIVLRQAVGTDIIFDKEKTISFDGDSGPYLQYSLARARSVLRKGDFKQTTEAVVYEVEATTLVRMIARLPDVLDRAREDFTPSLVINYLTALAGEFNSYYASNKIIDEADASRSASRLMLVAAFARTMENGLSAIAIPVPEKM